MTRHPGIWQIGKVRDDGTTVTVEGWGLSFCAAKCKCHRHPQGGHLVISQDETAGLLGLEKFTGGPPCDCCEPWTADELEAVMRDVVDLATLETA